MDINLALICGIDIPIPECRLVVHQPTMKEIAYIGEQEFLIGVQCLCIDKNQQGIQDKSLLDSIDNFQIFMRLMQDPEMEDKKEIINNIFSLIFPEYKVSLLPRTLLFQNDNEVITVDENNFEYLQNVFKIAFCIDRTSTDFKPKGDKAKEIADKLKRARERVAAQRSDGGSTHIFSQYLSVLTIGLNSMSLSDCTQLTMYQLFDLIERYSLFTSWDMNIRSRMAGAKIDKPPENWMKSIH